MADLWQHFLSEHSTVLLVALGAGLLGIVSGALGSFAVLRKQSLLGDAISHAALPGVALAYLLTGSKSPLVLVLGAAVAGWVATLLIMGILRGSRVKEDAALGLVLSAFFGLGLMILTYIQSYPRAAGGFLKLLTGPRPVEGPAGLKNFLFGQAATLLPEDLLVMAVLGGLALAILLVCWKQFKLLSFDPEFAVVQGLPVRSLDVLLTLLLVVAIVVGLQTVGVVLMSALVVAPATAARQWTDRLGVMVTLSAACGCAAGVGGAVASNSEDLPAGPTIVLCVSGLVLISLLLAPRRGLLWEGVRQWRNRRQLHVDSVLDDLLTLARQHPGKEHAHSVAVLQAMAPAGQGVKRSLAELQRRGWARLAEGGWLLTSEGEAEAQRRWEGRA